MNQQQAEIKMKREGSEESDECVKTKHCPTYLSHSSGYLGHHFNLMTSIKYFEGCFKSHHIHSIIIKVNFWGVRGGKKLRALPNYGLIHFFAAIKSSDEDFLSREIISCHQRALSSSALNKSDPFIFLVKNNPVGIYGKCILECPKFIASMVMELYLQGTPQGVLVIYKCVWIEAKPAWLNV